MPTPAPCVWVLAPVSARVCCSGLKSSASPLDSSPHFITCTNIGLHPVHNSESGEGTRTRAYSHPRDSALPQLNAGANTRVAFGWTRVGRVNATRTRACGALSIALPRFLRSACTQRRAEAVGSQRAREEAGHQRNHAILAAAAPYSRFPDRHFPGLPRVCAWSIRTRGSCAHG